MAHDESTAVSWILQVTGEIVAATLAGIGSAALWLAGKLSPIMITMEAIQAQLNEHHTRLAVGERDFKNLGERLDVVMESMQKVEKKQDQIMYILLNGKSHGD